MTLHDITWPHLLEHSQHNLILQWPHMTSHESLNFTRSSMQHMTSRLTWPHLHKLAPHDFMPHMLKTCATGIPASHDMIWPLMTWHDLTCSSMRHMTSCLTPPTLSITLLFSCRDLLGEGISYCTGIAHLLRFFFTSSTHPDVRPPVKPI